MTDAKQLFFNASKVKGVITSENVRELVREGSYLYIVYDTYIEGAAIFKIITAKVIKLHDHVVAGKLVPVVEADLSFGSIERRSLIRLDGNKFNGDDLLSGTFSDKTRLFAEKDDAENYLALLRSVYETIYEQVNQRPYDER